MIKERKTYLLITVLAVCVSLLLFTESPQPYDLRSLRFFWGMGHLLCFCLWSLVYIHVRRRKSVFTSSIEILVLTFLLGGMSEVLQPLVGRHFSWKDIFLNVLGALVGILFSPQILRTFSKQRVKKIRLISLGMLLFTFTPLFIYIVDDIIAFRQFPLLSGFETPFEYTRWGNQIVRRHDEAVSFSGKRSLRVELDTSKYSGIGLNGAPSDWSRHESLSLQVYNPVTEPLVIFIRIHDQFYNISRSDRYQKKFSIKQGWNHILISLDSVSSAPQKRLLDLSSIGGLWIYAYELNYPRIVYLDDLTLL